MDLPESVPTLHRDDVELLEQTRVYQGFFALDKVRLRHRLFAGGWSAPVSREIFVRGPAVGVLLFDPHRDLIGLVEQFRLGALDDPSGPWCLEVVAGMIETGESPAAVAVRETFEETGLTIAALEPICRYIASPGGSTEAMHLFCACTDLEHAGGVFGLAEEGEDIRVHILPAAAVFDALYSGRFNNAATLISLQWLQLQHARLREQGLQSLA